MRIIVLLSVVSLMLRLSFCGYPITDPYDATKYVPYNLIDTDPTCFWNGICPMFYPGGELSSFPNSEERFQHLLHNMHRVFVNQSIDISLGYLFYGTGGEKAYFARGGDYCGDFVPGRKPLYWYSDANQAARWKQYDENTCDQTWYDEDGNDAHVTCKTGSTNKVFNYRSAAYAMKADRCEYFSDNCGFGMRAHAFCRDGENEDTDDCMFASEALCGGNSCLESPSHCDPIFGDLYDYVGKGFVEGMNGVCSVYSAYTKQIWYPLVMGAHFEAETKIPEMFYPLEDKRFGLWLEYHSINKTEKAQACYALYDEQLNLLPVLVSGFPYDKGYYNDATDFYSADSYQVLFLEYFDRPTAGCEPYAFVCRTSAGNTYRLPEETEYYFGTEWMDWDWVDMEAKYGLSCKENHYYLHEDEGWTVNGGPNLTQSDIWYYEEGNKCEGCDKIDVLDCLYACVAAEYPPLDACTEACRANVVDATDPPTSIPTLAVITTVTPEPTLIGGCVVYQLKKSYKNVYNFSKDDESIAAYVEMIRQKMVQKRDDCGEATESVPSAEFFYYLKYKESKAKIVLKIYACCGGIGNRFPADFSVPEDVSKYWKYKENDAIILHRAETLVDIGSEWTNPEKFGVKQYVVFSLIGLLVIGCIFGSIYGRKYYKKQKMRKDAKDRNKNNKSRDSERNLARSIEMHADENVNAGHQETMPGPTDMDQIDGNQQHTRNDSTDGDNRYTKAFIKQQRESTTLTAPPVMQMLGGHNAVPSASYETPAVILNAPPRMSSVEKAKDTEAVANDDDDDADDENDVDSEQEQLNDELDDDEDEMQLDI